MEFVVNEDYTARPPKEPTYFFLIDISKSSFDNNVPYYAIHAIKACLLENRFNGGNNSSFGIAFFDKNLHLLNLRKKVPKLVTVYEGCTKDYSLPMD